MKIRFPATIILATAIIQAGWAEPPTGWQRGAELSWSPTSQIQDPNVTNHALVIGISRYAGPAHATPWRNLATADKDAEAVATVLAKEYGFHVTTLINEQATREAIFSHLGDLLDLGLNDAAVVYFAGHGYYDEKQGEGFWIPHDAAFKKGERLAREDWIWNSNISKMLNGSEARHILVIADACYGGSLFRGATEPAAGADAEWYKRAHATPSRYLISSGDMEPVSDEGSGHSVFAAQLLENLAHPGHNIFSASDLGFAIRQKVSTLTGQMVKMGPLNLSTHAGGEFVFIKTGTGANAP